MILIKALNKSGSNQIFIRTDQLDGETDWKLRKAPTLLQAIPVNEIVTLNGHIQYYPPSKIYEFEGVLSYMTDNDNEIKKEALGLENTLWASSILASEDQ